MDFIADPEHTNIGIVTYTNVVQLYTAGSGDPAVVIMSDVNAPFAPVPRSKLLFNVKEDRVRLEAVIEKAATSCEALGKLRNPSCSGAALKCAIDVLSGESGKVLWFLMDAPSVGIGTLSSRNQPALYNTDKEMTLLTPAPTASIYSNLARACLASCIAVDVFVCAQSEVDLASLMPISAAIGGEVYYYPLFNSAEYPCIH